MPGISRLRSWVALFLALAAVPQALRASDTPDPGLRKQEIIFDEIAGHSAADAPFDIAARATSGLPLAFEVVSGPAAIDGRRIRLTGSPGLVIVRASQAGNIIFLPARDAERAFLVQARPAAPRITAQPVAMDATVGGAILISVEVSGEPAPALQWRRNGTPISGATGPTLAIAQSGNSDAGSYDVVATNDSGSVTSQHVSLGVERRIQFISFAAPAGQLEAGRPVTLSASSSSGLPVQFEITSGSGFITGTSLTAQSGSVTVRAIQQGDSQYAAAAPVVQTLQFGTGRL